MRKALWIVTVIAGLSCSVAASAAAESKPLTDLPSDLAHWSTLWMELPRQMYGVGQEEGPVSAMTWGPVRGTIMMMDATGKALWDAVKYDQRPGRGDAILRYEF